MHDRCDCLTNHVALLYGPPHCLRHTANEPHGPFATCTRGNSTLDFECSFHGIGSQGPRTSVCEMTMSSDYDFRWRLALVAQTQSWIRIVSNQMKSNSSKTIPSRLHLPTHARLTWHCGSLHERTSLASSSEDTCVAPLYQILRIRSAAGVGDNARWWFRAKVVQQEYS